MQRLELEQQLEDMRERMAREKKTRQQDVAHEQWVTEQKRNLQAIKIEKVPQDHGLSLYRPPCTDLLFGGVETRLQYAPPLKNRPFRPRLGFLFLCAETNSLHIGFSVAFLSRQLK